MNRTIVTKADAEDPVPVEIMERSIVEIAAAMKKINATRLTRDALVTLIHRHVRCSRMDINDVLDHLRDLEKIHLTPRKK